MLVHEFLKVDFSLTFFSVRLINIVICFRLISMFDCKS